MQKAEENKEKEMSHCILPEEKDKDYMVSLFEKTGFTKSNATELTSQMFSTTTPGKKENAKGRNEKANRTFLISLSGLILCILSKMKEMINIIKKENPELNLQDYQKRIFTNPTFKLWNDDFISEIKSRIAEPQDSSEPIHLSTMKGVNKIIDTVATIIHQMKGFCGTIFYVLVNKENYKIEDEIAKLMKTLCDIIKEQPPEQCNSTILLSQQRLRSEFMRHCSSSSSSSSREDTLSVILQTFEHSIGEHISKWNTSERKASRKNKTIRNQKIKRRGSLIKKVIE